jgi:hypothetical protein
MDALTLTETLAGVDSMSLLGLTLLENHSPTAGEWFPRDIPSEKIVAATVEFIQYGQRVQASAHRLQSLHAVVLALPCLEYGL